MDIPMSTDISKTWHIDHECFEIHIDFYAANAPFAWHAITIATNTCDWDITYLRPYERKYSLRGLTLHFMGILYENLPLYTRLSNTVLATSNKVFSTVMIIADERMLHIMHKKQACSSHLYLTWKPVWFDTWNRYASEAIMIHKINVDLGTYRTGLTISGFGIRWMIVAT